LLLWFCSIILKLDIMIPPMLLFLLRIALAIQYLFCLNMKLRIDLFLFIHSMLDLFYCFYIYSHVYTLYGPPILSFLASMLPSRMCSALLFSNFVEEKTEELIRKT
jgi:hypothetical protein